MASFVSIVQGLCSKNSYGLVVGVLTHELVREQCIEGDVDLTDGVVAERP